MRIDYNLNKHWDAWLSYGFTLKDSARPLNDYAQNIISLGVGYRF